MNSFEKLHLEKIEENLFRGKPEEIGLERVFGGYVLAQALLSTASTVIVGRCHSLHSYFLRPGDPHEPILYEVDRVRNGKSFSTRRVSAVQRGRVIFIMTASFQIPEEGLVHQFKMPSVPPPEDLPTDIERMKKSLRGLTEEQRKTLSRERPIELKRVEAIDFANPKKRLPVQHIWLRSKERLGADDPEHQAFLAYASDMGLLSTSSLPHKKSWLTGLQTASLDHSMWFHDSFRIDKWTLAVIESPKASNSRGFNRCLMFSAEGSLIASVAQEGLMRVLE